MTAAKELGKEGAKDLGKDALAQAKGTQGNQTGNGNTGQARSEQNTGNAEGASANRRRLLL